MKHAVRKQRRRGTRPTNTGDSSSTVTIDQTPYLNAADVVAYLRGVVSVNTLANWRSKGIGPKATKVGVKALYTRESVDTFVREQQEGAAAPPA